MPQLHEVTDRSLATTTEATASSIEGGRSDLADMARRLAPYCARSESRQRVRGYLRGLLREAERKHSGQVAEACGEPTPYGCQSWLARADWDAAMVRDELRTDRSQHLGDPHGVLVLDETGLVNKGRPSAGVARQYTGTVGTVEHGQSGVCLGSASPLGQAVRDRERSRPHAWTGERERGQQVGIPGDRGVATKPQRARQLRARACAVGVPATWVPGDRVDGHNRRLRRWLEGRPQAYVLAVSGQESGWVDGRQRSVKTLLAALPAGGWRRLSAGDGTKGPRWADWRWPPVIPPEEPGWCRWLLVRRRVSAPPDLTAYVVFARQVTTLEEVVRVAGSRWTIASGFEEAKGAVGLEHDDVRRWTGWDRHITLAMWAYALVVVMRAGTSAVEALTKSLPPAQERSPLTGVTARQSLRSR